MEDEKKGLWEKAKERIKGVAGKAEVLLDDAKEVAGEAGKAVGETVRDMSGRASEVVEEAREKAADLLDKAEDAVRRKPPEPPAEPKA